MDAPHADDRTLYYVQTNNPTEEILRKVGFAHPLQSCGPTAAVRCMAALGRAVAVRTSGRYLPQPDEVLMGWFNDPVNYLALRALPVPALFRADPSEIPGNRIAPWYPLAVREVFGNPCGFVDGLMDWRALVEQLQLGRTAQLCLVDPGHFIPVVKYDAAADALVYDDPWPNRHPTGIGWHCAMTKDEYLGNVKPFALVYS
jgi:hypothetical protein